MKGYASYLNGTQQTPPVNRKGWRDSCLQQHSTWDHMFWDEEAALALISQHYAWFLPTWKAYDREIARADVARIFALHHFGGVWLDLDVQCFTDMSPFLEGHDVVLQGSTEEWDQGVINCAMASVANHRLWMTYAHLLPETQKEASTFSATGPAALAQAVANYYSLSKPITVGSHADSAGTSLMVYPVGQWFVPCMGNWEGAECNKAVVKKLIAGDLMPELAGYHRFQGTWWAEPHDDPWMDAF